MGIDLSCLKSTLLNNIPLMVGEVNILGAVKVLFTVVISEFLLLYVAVLGGTKPTDFSTSPVKLFDRNLGAGYSRYTTSRSTDNAKPAPSGNSTSGATENATVSPK